MKTLFVLLLAVSMANVVQAADILEPATTRFSQESEETPDFRRHVLPLMGRLGCNGRACHGSFQGQGGFQLSLFGYDFAADHEAIAGGDSPRVNTKEPAKSLVLLKPTLQEDHEGGERFQVGSWEHRLLEAWIKGGAKALADESPEFDRLEVLPSEVVFNTTGETYQLKVIAHWKDGTREDVTPLARYRTNDESIATIGEDGLITAVGKGDTHVIAFYDNGVVPVQTILPITDLVGDKYPQVPTPTKIDELVVAKLRKLGVLPSDLCTDEEFLRRVSLDLTGTLPSPDEVVAFVGDASPDKRAKKIDELLERPTYAAWWATRLCDYTGNNTRALMQGNPYGQQASRQWYDWIYERLRSNAPYDEIVEGIVLATGRKEGQSYEEYCQEMTEYVAEEDAEFSERESMPHYWARRTIRRPEDKTLAFCYSFMGLRMQCAQCHKHPFDQWTKQDFDEFTAFCARIDYGLAPDAQQISKQMSEDLGLDGKKNNNQRQRLIAELLKDGKVVPWQEVFVREPRANNNRRNAKGAKRRGNKPAPQYGRLLAGDRVDLSKYDDPRTAIMDWLRSDPNRYFARSIVNRVWANYFHAGIVDPPDDLNLANPPSNAALLDYLAQAFVDHDYDLKWLHREICNSRTYQLSWIPNDTNLLDVRNFSHAVPRRMPAEVAYDAVVMATAGDDERQKLISNPLTRAIGVGMDGSRGARNNPNGYVFTVFGKPQRETNCDCERSSEPSLLQTIYLRNDNEMLGLIERKGGWWQQVSRQLNIPSSLPSSSGSEGDSKADEEITERIAQLERRLNTLQEAGDTEPAERVQKQLTRLRQMVKRESSRRSGKSEPAVAITLPEVVRQAYLRSLGRLPTEDELARATQHLELAEDKSAGVKDLLWALLNTKEFIVNH